MASKVGTPVRVLRPCGTEAAYQRHIRYNRQHNIRTPIDEPCRIAHNKYQRRVYSGETIAEREDKAIRQEALEALAFRHPEEFRQLMIKVMSDDDKERVHLGR